MKIVYVTNDISGQGGVARTLSVKSSYLVEKFNYQIEIISSSEPSIPFFSFLNPVLIKHIPVSGTYVFRFFSYFRRLKKEIIEAKPDCVIICDNGIKGHLTCFLDFKVPVVFESHSIDLIPLSSNTGFFTFFTNYFKKILISLSIKRVSKHVVLTKSVANLLKSKNAHVIPNPIWLRPEVRESLDSNKVVAVGRLTPSKGYERMCKVWKKLHQTHPDWTLDIYGEGSQKKELLEQINQHSLHSIVNFKGSVSKTENLYKGYAFMIHTSLYESFPMVLMEAMAYGLPVVAFDCPVGPREIIANSEDGFLVDNNDEDAFVGKATSLMSDYDLRNRLGQKAFENIRRFEVKAIMRQWHELFVDITDNQDLLK